MLTSWVVNGFSSLLVPAFPSTKWTVCVAHTQIELSIDGGTNLCVQCTAPGCDLNWIWDKCAMVGAAARPECVCVLLVRSLACLHKRRNLMEFSFLFAAAKSIMSRVLWPISLFLSCTIPHFSMCSPFVWMLKAKVFEAKMLGKHTRADCSQKICCPAFTESVYTKDLSAHCEFIRCFGK